MRKLFSRVFVSEDASLIRERDFFILMDAGCEPKTRRDFLHVCRQTGNPIKYAFLTHHHWDHVHNMKHFRQRFPRIQTVSNHRVRGEMKFQDETRMTLGDTEYVIIPTPGHSPKGDDICIYMPHKKVLFTGDLCQPQGPSYHRVDFSTPVPYFHLGEEYIHSLKKVLRLGIKHVITGHGLVFTPKALETTLEVAERMRDLAREHVRKSHGMKNSLVCRTIFQEVASERGFRNPEWRFDDPYYHECDEQGLLYWVKKFRHEN